MEKIRINFTVQDYFDYVGTNPYYSTKRRMLESIPYEFEKVGYNIKYKKLYNYWRKNYRVHMSLRMSEEELKKILDKYDSYSHKLENVSYKIITNKFN